MAYIVAITGGIGCGKTTISNLFQALGVPVIDDDIIARNVVEKGSPALSEIINHFGQEFLLPNEELDRKKLRETIFNDDKAKQWLNNLLHPIIRAESEKLLQKTSTPYAIWVSPLLLENNTTANVNRILVIDIPQEQQIKRVALRDGSSAKLIKSIIDQQVSRQIRLQKADDIIDNTQPIDMIKQKVEHLHSLYLGLSKVFN